MADWAQMIDISSHCKIISIFSNIRDRYTGLEGDVILEWFELNYASDAGGKAPSPSPPAGQLPALGSFYIPGRCPTQPSKGSSPAYCAYLAFFLMPAVHACSPHRKRTCDACVPGGVHAPFGYFNVDRPRTGSAVTPLHAGGVSHPAFLGAGRGAPHPLPVAVLVNKSSQHRQIQAGSVLYSSGSKFHLTH
eukprot:195118-Chlamydomonas_euryale.AAC.6